MPRNNVAVRAPRPHHDEETQEIFLDAQRLVVKGELTKALQLLKRGADTALAAGDDRRALELARAAAELRAKQDLGPAHSARASAVIAVASQAHSPASALPVSRKGPPPLRRVVDRRSTESDTIDVDAGWLESVEVEGNSCPGDSAIGEAVRVWVGPGGALTLFAARTPPPKDSVEALLVTHVAAAGLAQRLARK